MGLTDQSALRKYGLLNLDTEDLGAIASRSREEYEFYCTSEKCCAEPGEEVQVYNSKTGQNETVRRYKRKPRVLVAVSVRHIGECPHCNFPVTSRRKKQVKS